MSQPQPSLLQTDDGYQVIFQNRTLYSPRSPAASADRRARAASLAPGTLVFLPSPLLGYGIDTLLKRLPKSSHLLMVELEPALALLSKRHMSSDIRDDENVSFVCGEEELHEWMNTHKLGFYRRCTLVTVTGGFSLHAGRYREIATAFERDIRLFWQNKMTLIHMGRLYLRNLISNLASVPEARDIGELSVRGPIVVAGAGASLEETIPLIKARRSQLFVLAVDTAWPVLELRGVSPDAVVVLEPQSGNVSDLVGVPVKRPILLCDVSAHPAHITHIPMSNIYFFSSQFADLRWLKRLRQRGVLPSDIPPLGSVGVAAAYIARRITAGPVILAGLDFSYVPGKTHATGAPAHTFQLSSMDRFHPDTLWEPSMARKRIKRAGKKGQTVETDIVLATYAEQLGSFVNDQGMWYDLSESGLPTGAKLVGDLPGLDQVLASAGSAASRHGNQPRFSPRRLPDVSTIREVVKFEIARLERIEPLFRRRNTSAGEQELLSLLRETDYLYVDFPDPPPLPNNFQSFLARALVAASHYQRRFHRSLSLIA